MDEKLLVAPDQKEASKEEQKTQKKKEIKFARLFDEDQVEIKLLSAEDVDDALAVMKKCAFDVTKDEVFKVISYGTSFGCYDNRMLVAVGLSWPASYDSEKKALTTKGGQNALYLEEPAVLLMHEGYGLRRVLVKAREGLAKQRGFAYIIAYLDADTPKKSIEEYIKETGSQLEKVYLEQGFSFVSTQHGILAFKSVR